MSDTRKFLEAVMDSRTPVQSYNPATRRYEDKYLRYNDAKEEIEELGSVGFGQSMMPKAQNVPQGNMQTPTLGSRGFSSSFDDIRPKRSMSENVSEFMVTNPASRAVGLSLQGMANASFNPAGHLAKSFGMDVRPIEPQNWVERGIEEGSRQLTDAYILMPTVMGTVAKTARRATPNSLYSNILAKASEFTPAVATSAFAGGAAVGVVQPENLWAEMALNLAGGTVVAVGSNAVGNGINMINNTASKPVSNYLHYYKNYGRINSSKEALSRQLANARTKHQYVADVSNKSLKNVAVDSDWFNDMPFGNISPVKLKELNQIRGMENVAQMRDNKLMMPQNVVKHIYEGRVIDDGMGCDDVANLVSRAYHSPKGIVDKTKYAHIQAVINPRKKLSDVGFVSVNPNNGENVVKTAFVQPNTRVAKSYYSFKGSLDGRDLSSSVRSSDATVAAARFSDLQAIHKGTLPWVADSVNGSLYGSSGKMLDDELLYDVNYKNRY